MILLTIGQLACCRESSTTFVISFDDLLGRLLLYTDVDWRIQSYNRISNKLPRLRQSGPLTSTKLYYLTSPVSGRESCSRSRGFSGPVPLTGSDGVPCVLDSVGGCPLVFTGDQPPFLSFTSCRVCVGWYVLPESWLHPWVWILFVLLSPTIFHLIQSLSASLTLPNRSLLF